ncbi:hypothetical protein ACQ4PT_066665 [Festuca glaucescens]
MGSTGCGGEAAGEVTRADFPDGFVFGVATSAYQIEGARNEGGKGDSIWDVFADNKDGLGKEINEEGVAFYNNLIDFMIEKGIQPYATLYHWDLPHNLHETVGGWLSDRIVEYFALYAEACFANFGDRVKHWITINEPLQTSLHGYGIGIFAPGVCEGEAAEPFLAAHHQILAHAASVDVYRRKFKACLCEGEAAEPFLAAHHQILAHAASVDVYRRKFKAVQGGTVGFVVDCEWAEPASDKIEDQAAAARHIDFLLGWYLDPIYFGDYPESMRKRLGDRLPNFSDKDREFIRNKIDFIGLNHYTSKFIANQPNPQPKEIHFCQARQIEILDKRSSGEAIGERAASEWLCIVPWGIRKMINYIAKKYDNPIIYITENGMDDEDDPSATLDQFLNDTKRVGFFKGYVGAVAEAIKDGADVRGYFAWSFLDNFEWAQGFTKRFGIVYVDYKNGLSRHPKASAMWFSHLLNVEGADSKPGTN